MVMDRRTCIRIAHWYYELGLTQEQIGKRLQIPRQRINKIVNSLVADGIVTIKINGLDQDFLRLESAIEERFGIQQAVVADYEHSETPLLDILGGKAAEFLDDFIKDRNTIGISWGSTVGETVSSMRSANKTGCHIVQLVGGMNTNTNGRMNKPDEITRMLAGKLNCSYQNLYAPAMFNNDMTRAMIIKEESVRSVLETMRRCDIVVMGIGELSGEATTVQNGYITSAQYMALREGGYVGDFCFNHFDINGRFEDGEFSRLTLGIRHETLKAVPHVIAVAGGLHKRDAIVGALKTGCIDILITDSVTARSMLEDKPEETARQNSAHS